MKTKEMKEPDRYNRSTNSAADILDRPDVRDRSPNPPINCLTGCLAALALSRLVALVRSTTGKLVKKGSHDLRSLRFFMEVPLNLLKSKNLVRM